MKGVPPLEMEGAVPPAPCGISFADAVKGVPPQVGVEPDPPDAENAGYWPGRQLISRPPPRSRFYPQSDRLPLLSRQPQLLKHHGVCDEMLLYVHQLAGLENVPLASVNWVGN
ncbi:MAG: hypothetical protein NZM04_04700 [Methylacidiphilales bacterium]|nr:hypothetical protein [Candidatus Methylacidiphilales bacterium]